MKKESSSKARHMKKKETKDHYQNMVELITKASR
jgi:hypothetical protein